MHVAVENENVDIVNLILQSPEVDVNQMTIHKKIIISNGISKKKKFMLFLNQNYFKFCFKKNFFLNEVLYSKFQ